MTKREMLQALEHFEDGEIIYVSLLSADNTESERLIIGAADKVAAWHGDKAFMMALRVSLGNFNLTNKVVLPSMPPSYPDPFDEDGDPYP